MNRPNSTAISSPSRYSERPLVTRGSRFCTPLAGAPLRRMTGEPPPRHRNLTGADWHSLAAKCQYIIANGRLPHRACGVAMPVPRRKRSAVTGRPTSSSAAGSICTDNSSGDPLAQDFMSGLGLTARRRRNAGRRNRGVADDDLSGRDRGSEVAVRALVAG